MARRRSPAVQSARKAISTAIATSALSALVAADFTALNIMCGDDNVWSALAAVDSLLALDPANALETASTPLSRALKATTKKWEDRHVRWAALDLSVLAAESDGQATPRDRSAVLQLTSAVLGARTDEAWRIRWAVAETLGVFVAGGGLGSPARLEMESEQRSQVVAALIDMLQDGDILVVYAAARAILLASETGHFDGGTLRSAAADALIRFKDDWVIREALVNAIGDIAKDYGAEVLPALATLLTSSGFADIHLGASALAKCSENGGTEALTMLLEATTHESSDVRRTVAHALIQNANASLPFKPEVIVALREALTDDDRSVRREVVRCFERTERSDLWVVRALLGSLQDEDAKIRDGASRALVKIGKVIGLDEIAPLLQELSNADPYVRMTVAQTLAETGEAGGLEVTTALLVALRDRKESVRMEVARALAKLGEASRPEVVAAVLASLRSNATGPGEAAWSRRAADALKDVCAAAGPETISTLIAALSDARGDARRAIVAALAHQSSVPDVTTALLQALQDEDAGDVRQRIVEALAPQCSVPDVTTALLEALQEEGLRGAAIWALRNVNDAEGPRAVQALLQPLQGDDPYRTEAAKVIALIGQSGGPEGTATIRELLLGADLTLRRKVARAMSTSDKPAWPEILDTLLAIAQHQDHDEFDPSHSHIIDVLAKTVEGPRSEIVNALLGALWYDDPWTRIRAAQGLVRNNDVSNPRVMSALLDLMIKCSDTDVRAALCEAMGTLGEASTPGVVWVLLSKLRDPEPEVNMAAARALAQISQTAPRDVVAEAGEPQALLNAMTGADITVRKAIADALLAGARRSPLAERAAAALHRLLPSSD